MKYNDVSMNIRRREHGRKNPGKIRETSGSYRRRVQIEECLFANMLKMPYGDIRVAELCRQLGISRKAFYNYYQGKDDCLAGYIGRVIRDSMIHIATAVSDQAEPLEIAMVLLDFWKNRRSFWDVLVKNHLLHFAMMENIRYVQHEDPGTLEMLSTPDCKSDEDILACYMSVLLTLALQWYLRDFQDPTEEMARKLLRLMHQPIIPGFEE